MVIIDLKGFVVFGAGGGRVSVCLGCSGRGGEGGGEKFKSLNGRAFSQQSTVGHKSRIVLSELSG